MKKIWTMRLMTVVYLAPILLALGACMSGSGTQSQSSGCSGSSCNLTSSNCGYGTTFNASSCKCCGNGQSSC